MPQTCAWRPCGIIPRQPLPGWGGFRQRLRSAPGAAAKSRGRLSAASHPATEATGGICTRENTPVGELPQPVRTKVATSPGPTLFGVHAAAAHVSAKHGVHPGLVPLAVAFEECEYVRIDAEGNRDFLLWHHPVGRSEHRVGILDFVGIPPDLFRNIGVSCRVDAYPINPAATPSLRRLLPDRRLSPGRTRCTASFLFHLPSGI